MIAPWKNEKIKLVYGRPEIKASVEIILSVFSVVFLLVFAIRPTLATVASLQKKIEDQTVVNNKLNTKINQLVRANTDLGSYADRLPDYFLAVTDVHDESGLAKRIEVVSRGSNVKINNLSFDAVPLIGTQINLSSKEKGAEKPTLEAGGKVASYIVTFDISGGANQVFDFLAKLENIDRVALISSVNIKKEEIRSVGTIEVVNDLRVTGKANAYYVLNPQ